MNTANYLNEKGYDFVYYIDPENGERYPRNFYGYIRQEWQAISISQIEEIAVKNERALFIALKDEDMPLGVISPVDISTEKLAVYMFK